MARKSIKNINNKLSSVIIEHPLYSAEIGPLFTDLIDIFVPVTSVPGRGVTLYLLYEIKIK